MQRALALTVLSSDASFIKYISIRILICPIIDQLVCAVHYALQCNPYIADTVGTGFIVCYSEVSSLEGWKITVT